MSSGASRPAGSSTPPRRSAGAAARAASRSPSGRATRSSTGCAATVAALAAGARGAFDPTLAPATGQLVNWWEGNVAFGPDGNIYVGNTGGGVYSLTPDGDQRWAIQRGNSVWTTPAFDAAGNSYWGSVDFYVFSLDPAGNQRWQTFTPGFVTSSPALGSDGTVYIGSFDRSLYALDPATGAERWAFPTADHIYSSPALAPTPPATRRRSTSARPTARSTRSRPTASGCWRYDTGDPVRSSPVLGRAPKGDGKIVYVGSSNGSLYALDAETGKRRWSFDTTPENADLARPQRPQRLAGAGQARRLHRRRARPGLVRALRLLPPRRQHALHDRPGARSSGRRVTRVFAVTPGGTTLRGSTEHVPAATTLASRLVVRRNGETIDAAIDPAPFSVKSKPAVQLHHRALGRRPLPLHPPRRDPQARHRLQGQHRGRLDGRRRQRRLSRRRCTTSPSRFATSTPPPRSRRARCRRSSSAGWRCPSRRCCRASTRSASTPTT